jgi:hypothetical protein
MTSDIIGPKTLTNFPRKAGFSDVTVWGWDTGDFDVTDKYISPIRGHNRPLRYALAQKALYI